MTIGNQVKHSLLDVVVEASARLVGAGAEAQIPPAELGVRELIIIEVEAIFIEMVQSIASHSGSSRANS